MRLLGLTNFYPPLGYGYGAICHDVMQELDARGHRCVVLCAAGESDSIPITTGLRHVPAAWRKPVAGLAGELASQKLVRAAIDDGAEAALVWHMRGIGKGSLTLLHRARIPVIYMLGDLWVIYEHPGPPSLWRMWTALDHVRPWRAARQTLGLAGKPIGLELRAPPIETDGIVCFASEWLRRRHADIGFRPQCAHVIPNGIPSAGLAALRTGETRTEPLSVLFAGRLDPPKGADIAVAALAEVDGLHLMIAGGGRRSSVLAIERQVVRLGLAERVRLVGELPRDSVAELMRQCDVFVMPAREPDAFGLVYLEAMANGAVVIGTAKGGAAELCEDGVNCLVIDESDPTSLPAALCRLRDDVALRERLRAAGEATAGRYGLGTMVDSVERLLSRIAEQRDAGT